MTILSADFYRREDTVQIAKELVGKVIITEFNGLLTSARIVETEAYKAPEDKACHAYLNRKTKRTKTMFLPGGVAYIYLCYGIHHLFNVVTGPEGAAHAVLIRAVEPLAGQEIMLRRRGLEKLKPQLSAGPGVMSKALGIEKAYDAISLTKRGGIIRIADAPVLPPSEIIAGPRVGIDYAEECVDWPWRFYQRDCSWVSKTRKKKS
ncbi:MAG: DNA-3-methyladenine glycosylase [Lewinella sp.]|jgi:DNA-3-methyladenine glycosylase|uniref:DNA-3-methyladenine glycosylase n=1 Tax=Lewinella sp. TaxID=2004506 RepID=UPI003D6AB05E